MNQFWVFLLLFFLFTGCSAPQKEIEKPVNQIIYPNSFEEIKKKGKLTVLTENSAASFFILKGKEMGFEIQLLKRFCKEHRLTLEIKIIEDLDEITDRLIAGEGDLIACNFNPTTERDSIIDFTLPIMEFSQVLIQKNKSVHDSAYIASIFDLSGRTISVRKNSSFNERLKKLSSKLDVPFYMHYIESESNTDKLIQMVSNGDIPFTVADENVALINQRYYSNIDCNLKLSKKTPIAWAMKKNSSSLKDSLNSWIVKNRESKFYKYLFRKYFKHNQLVSNSKTTPYSSLGGNQLSQYDSIIKKIARKYNLDWRFIAALIYEESHFNINARSWVGAFGLMQIMPSTAKKYNVTYQSNAEAQINAGTKSFCTYLKRWSNEIKDSTELLKYCLGSYNAGLGHIEDAYRLAEAYNCSPIDWEEGISYFLEHKSTPYYYKNKVVKYGYCRGSQTTSYVEAVLNRYSTYRNVFN